LDSGEQEEEIKSIKESTTLDMVMYSRICAPDYAITVKDITEALNQTLEGINGILILEECLRRLIPMPLNWYRRTTINLSSATASSFLPRNCPGVRSPTKVVRILTDWEVFDNEDGTTQYIIRDDASILKCAMYSTQCITNLTIVLPKLEGVEYDHAKLHIKSRFKESFVNFEGNKVTIPELIWTNTYYKSNIQIDISITGSKEITQKLALSPIEYHFENIVLDESVAHLMKSVFDEIKIEKIGTTIRWKSINKTVLYKDD
jgi:hypothetical protein